MIHFALSLSLLGGIGSFNSESSRPLLERVTHGFAKNGDVKLHYVSLGNRGPLVVMFHGFPDYWYTWRHVMEALASDHHVVAFDLRGYNRSEKPEGDDNYAMRILISDVVAGIHHLGHERAIVVAHDWGAAIAWQVAMWRPDVVDRLVILNMPHPNGFLRELGSKETSQHENSQYARDFQDPGAAKTLTPENLSSWVRDPEARKHYLEAFARSDFDAMLAYYRRNFPKAAPATAAASPPSPPALASRRVQAPTLMFHGLEDRHLLADGLNDTWRWIDAELTLVTVPGAGHFVQQDAPEIVTRTIVSWLHRDGDPPATSPAMKALVNPTCPFSGDPVRADSITLYDGSVVGFCNTGCRDKFAHDPVRYMSEVGPHLQKAKRQP